MATVGGVLARVRRPAYTGANRCRPCTLANVAIVLVLAAAGAWVWWPLGVAIAVAGLGATWLRGYLVPGTPVLMARYAPAWFLHRFGKAPAATLADDDGIDLEAALVDLGVATPCADVDDVCLADGFDAAWTDEIDALRGVDLDALDVATVFDFDPAATAVTERDGAFVAHADGRRLAQWESRAALLADVAAHRALARWDPGWGGRPPAIRAQVLGGLRIFIERCPACDGPIDVSDRTVTSCCSARQVVAGTCADCGDRVLEAVL